MKKNTIIILAFLLFLPMWSLADSDGKGGHPGAFRYLTLGGRASALGGAFAAIAEGGVGHLYNPAGACQSRKYDLALSYRAMHLQRRLGYASLSLPTREDATLSFDWIYAGSPDLESRDEQGNVIPNNDISYNENLIGINFSKKVISQLLAGGRVFYVQSNVGRINAYTAGVDLGLLSKIEIKQASIAPIFPLVQFGMSVENLGANYRWITAAQWQSLEREEGSVANERFPTNFRFGAALVSPQKHLVSADMEVNSVSMVKTHFGAEYVYDKLLSLRAGLDDLHPTFGTGLLKKFDKFALQIDLAYLLDKVGEGDDVLMSFDIVF